MIDKKLWPVFSEYIRLRDSDENGFCRCFTCSNIRYFRNMDCGHGVRRGHMATKYHEQNNHAQCKLCNGPAGGGKPKEYEEAVDKRYGPGTWVSLQFLSRKIAKFTTFEVAALILAYKEKIAELRAAKNLRD